MAKQTIGIGTAADDGTGDPLRTAFDKANKNFDELYWKLAQTIDLTSHGSDNVVIDVSDCESVEIAGFDLAMASSGNFLAQVSTDGGSTYKNGATDYLNPLARDGASTFTRTDWIEITSTSGASGMIVGLAAHGLRLAKPHMIQTVGGKTAGSGAFGHCLTQFAEAITHFKIYTGNASNITGGTLYVSKQ